jgi:hypothetical protein
MFTTFVSCLTPTVYLLFHPLSTAYASVNLYHDCDTNHDGASDPRSCPIHDPGPNHDDASDPRSCLGVDHVCPLNFSNTSQETLWSKVLVDSHIS